MADFTQDTIQPIETVSEDIFQKQDNDFRKIYNKKMYITQAWLGTDPADSNKISGEFAVVPVTGTITDIRLSISSCPTSGTPSVYVEKTPSGTNVGSGVNTQASNFSLPSGSSALSLQATLSNTLSNRQVVPGDRLSLVRSGSLSGSIGLTIMVEITYN